MITVGIATREGEVDVESVYDEGGLAVTPRLRLNNTFDFGSWVVTHISSGFGLHTWIDLPTQAAAFAVLQRVLPLGDWTKDAADIQRIEGLSRIVNEIMQEYTPR